MYRKPAVFIDGAEGTTGLALESRLARRDDVTLLSIDPEKRKDPAARKALFDAADLVFLCLPDQAAREAAALVDSGKTRLIDASTAHRVSPGWAYGFAELSPAHRAAIRDGARVANPGCHASGFLACAYPLVKAGMAPADYPFTCHSITGFSGGGKKMIAEYGQSPLPPGFESPRQYGLSQTHKHLPEMQKIAGLAFPPVFNPIVADFYAGMVVTVPLHNRLLSGRPTAEEVHALYQKHYEGSAFVRVMPFGGEGLEPPGFLPADALAGKDGMELFVFGHGEQTMVAARFDNLGKGASGAAVQNMNLMLGFAEETGLTPFSA